MMFDLRLLYKIYNHIRTTRLPGYCLSSLYISFKKTCAPSRTIIIYNICLKNIYINKNP